MLWDMILLMVLAKYHISPSLSMHWLALQGSHPALRSAGTAGNASSIMEVMTDRLYGNSAYIRAANDPLFRASRALSALSSALYWRDAFSYRSAAA
ncbi:MAG: hypothetical protein A4E42_00385 [Methanoregulaceae archaeon PtaU1.Bin222]|nr:MAG: hypothetical protein A4E42_00385 [Methanoregulaceae archaeon PtaU1.Bin222]